jgi:hypothetical protein
MPDNNTQSTVESIRNWLLVATSTAVVFFLLGYVIVESFISALEFQGMFWFSDAFYARAGSRFLLDVARSVLFHPILTVTAGFGVWLLIRASSRICMWVDRLRPGHVNQCHDITLIVISLLFSLLLLNFGKFFDPWLSLDKLLAHLGEQKSMSATIGIFLLERVPRYEMLLPKPAVWLYVILFLPLAVFLGRDLLHPIIQARASHIADQDTGSLENSVRRTEGRYLLWAAFIIYTILFVYGYGHYVYDWRVAQLTIPTAHQLEHGGSVSTDPTSGFERPLATVDVISGMNRNISTETAAANTKISQPLPLVPSPSVYLLAQINEDYFFWIKDSDVDIGRIVSSRHDAFNTVSFPLRQHHSLRELNHDRRVASKDLRIQKESPTQLEED